MSLFSQNLRFLRKKGNHNQDEIALLFTKRANTIGNWENQKSEPSLTELIKLGEFFKTSVEDLLNLDMEEAAGQPPRKTAAPAVSRTPVTSTPLADQGATEGNTDAFWLILRELRVMGDKLDILVSGMDSTGFKRSSDKSYH